jgi:hypothetical protein
LQNTEVQPNQSEERKEYASDNILNAFQPEKPAPNSDPDDGFKAKPDNYHTPKIF